LRNLSYKQLIQGNNHQSMNKFIALIPAAGSGSRMGNALPKQYLAQQAQPKP